MRIAIDWAKRGRELLILLAIATFITILAPFGSEHMSFVPRWIYWAGLLIIGSAIGETFAHFVLKWTERWPVLWSLAITSIAVSIPMTPIVAVASGWRPGEGNLQFWLSFFSAVWVISAFMTSMGYMLNRTFDAAGPDNLPGAGGTNEDAAAVFLQRLPVKYRDATLHGVVSEDHYLRVHTDKGDELILMRLADAIRELSDVDGLQTHRSWWVARAGVSDVRREKGRVLIVLPSGAEAPVSRTYLASVKEAGWL